MDNYLLLRPPYKIDQSEFEMIKMKEVNSDTYRGLFKQVFKAEYYDCYLIDRYQKITELCVSIHSEQGNRALPIDALIDLQDIDFKREIHDSTPYGICEIIYTNGWIENGVVKEFNDTWNPLR